MMLIRRFLLGLLLVLVSPLSLALTSALTTTHKIERLSADLLPPNSHSHLLIRDLNTPPPAHSAHSDLFPPASTLKLVTALAAKLELGDTFRYQTTLSQIGNDRVVTFSGDPTLTTADLAALFTYAGAPTHLQGDIWLDDSAFNGYEHAVGLPWDILGVCYSAPSSVITLDHNCFPASIYTQDDGTTRVYVPEQYPVTVTTQTTAISEREKKVTPCDLDLHTDPHNRYQLSGCLVNRAKPLPLNFAITNTRLYAQQRLRSELKRLGITVAGEIKIGSPTSSHSAKASRSATHLATHQSAPLPQLLDTMLKKSDNLIADNLTKTLGAHFYLQAGNFINGTAAIKQIIQTQTGIDLQQAQLADGSGLSRNNRFLAQDMAAILRYLYQHDDTLHLIELLPVAGESGTLHYRPSMNQAPIQGQIIAKSGSLYGSYNMAGYGLDKQGKPRTLFVQFVSDYYAQEMDVPKRETALFQFETQFYQRVIQRAQQP